MLKGTKNPITANSKNNDDFHFFEKWKEPLIYKDISGMKQDKINPSCLPKFGSMNRKVIALKEVISKYENFRFRG